MEGIELKFVQTVLGKVPINNIGKTDSHEHLIRIGGGEVIHGGNDFLMDSVDNAEKEISLYKNAGGDTIVEMTPCGSGRDINSLVKLSKTSKINIIATTGFHKSELYDRTHFLYRYSTEDIADLLIKDIEEGIDEYDYAGPIVRRSKGKAGVIKAAASYQVITEIEKKELKAAGIASVKTGFPVSLHLERGTMALEAVEILLQTGVRPDNIILGHIDRNPDLLYHKKIASKGVYLIYDGPGRIKYYTDEVISNLFKNMENEGFGSQILIGGDLGRRSYFKSYGGGPGLDYNLNTFVPRLLEIGLSETSVRNIYCENARNAFSNKIYEI